MLNASWGDQAVGRTRFVAFDKRTGKVVWWASAGFPPKDTYYSTPVVAVINGERLLITGGGDGGVHAFKVRTGEKVWSYIFGAGAVNCSPVVSGDLVYIGHGEDNLDRRSPGQGRSASTARRSRTASRSWSGKRTASRRSSPRRSSTTAGSTSATTSAMLYCLDAQGRQRTLETPATASNAKGSPVLADGKIYVGEVDGKFHILKPEDKKCTKLQRE